MRVYHRSHRNPCLVSDSPFVNVYAFVFMPNKIFFNLNLNLNLKCDVIAISLYRSRNVCGHSVLLMFYADEPYHWGKLSGTEFRYWDSQLWWSLLGKYIHICTYTMTKKYAASPGRMLLQCITFFGAVGHYNHWFIYHDDVIKWKHSPRYWPFVWGIQRWPVNSLYKDQWRGALLIYLICAWIIDCVNNREAGAYIN